MPTITSNSIEEIEENVPRLHRVTWKNGAKTIYTPGWHKSPPHEDPDSDSQEIKTELVKHPEYLGVKCIEYKSKFGWIVLEEFED